MFRINRTVPYTLTTILFLAQLAPAGIQINDRTSSDQKDCDIASLPDGSYITVWRSYLHDGSSGAIVARKLNYSGVPVSSEFQVNQTTEGDQAEPSICANPEGHYLITWKSAVEGTNMYDIRARLFDANSLPLSDESIISQEPRLNQGQPQVCVDLDNSFIAVWESEDLPGDSKRSICLRTIDSFAQPTGQEIVASDTPKYTCRFPDITSDGQGYVAITWLEDRTSNSVRLRRFDSTGTPTGDSLYVNQTSFKSLTSPQCDMNNRGYLAIVWDGDPNSAAADDIHARLFDPNGIALDDQFVANATTAGTQRNPSVSLNTQGSLLIGWDATSDTSDDKQDVRARLFAAYGTPLSDEFAVNQYTLEDQVIPALTYHDNGDFIIIWQSKNQDGSGWGIFSTASPTTQSSDLNADGVTNFKDYQLYSNSLAVPTADLHQDHHIDDLDLWTFCSQWLKPAME
ncbi:hypothetical protein ACFL3F_01415 [Planctomycetota bacterium]